LAGIYRLARWKEFNVRDGFVPYENEQRLAELEAMIERADCHHAR